MTRRSKPEDLHPTFETLLGRGEKESLLHQRSRVIWLYGLSGSGKSTLANALERSLHAEGYATQLLDGDNVRSGLTGDLGFSDADRRENIRRVAEVARLFLDAGVVTLVSLITPRREFREMARSIVGPEDFIEIYVECSYATCARRDVKGLYAKARGGGVSAFTGKDSAFEPPSGEAALTISTDGMGVEESLAVLSGYIKPRISLDR